jgi:hypothetical protein
MKRRSLLATIATTVPAAAGCVDTPVGSTPGDTESPTGDHSTPTDTPGEPRGRDDAVSVVDLGTAPRTYALAPTRYRDDDGGRVDLRFVETATADHPARVRATLHNRTDVENRFRLDWLPPFGRHASTVPRKPWSKGRHGREHTYRAELVFAPTGDDDLVGDPPAVERDGDGLWRAGEVTDWTPEPVLLAPDESVTADYHLVGHPDGAGDGRPTGVYEFSRGGERPLRVSVWNTERPGPTGESRFAGLSVPPLPGEGTTAWFHEADGSTETFVRPATERTDLPAAVLFTFVNHGRESTGCGHWQLYKLVDGEWFDLGPFVHTADCRTVRAGGSKRRVLRAAHGEALPCEEPSTTVGFLGGGRYAFVAGYGLGVDRSGALVEFDAPAVSVHPTDDVSASRDGDTVRVTSPRYGESEGDRRVLQVDRADAADRRVVAEQVLQRRGLRNTLSLFEAGVETVLLRTDRQVATRASGHGDVPTRFRFDGQAYAVSVMAP